MTQCWTSSFHLLLLLILAVALQQPQVIWGWVPPHPKSSLVHNFETVHDMRRRLNIQYNYTPQLLHPELCRFTSEEECQEADENLRHHAESHRRDLLVTAPSISNPSLGSINVLVLLIQFTDHQNREKVPIEQIESMWKGPIKRWFTLNSGGSYEINPIVVEWHVTDNTETHYSFGKRGVTSETQQMAWPILDKLDQSEGWDWTLFDKNRDGMIQTIPC